MNPNELKLSYPFTDFVPKPGTAFVVYPGVKWIKMPLPFVLNHINVWLLADEYEGKKGWTVIDCGIDCAEVRALWEIVFANELEGLPIIRVLVTHMHPDHVGLAHWMCSRWDAPLLMSMTDYAIACAWSARSSAGAGTGGEQAVKHFARHGLQEPKAQEKIRERGNYYPGLVPAMPSSFIRLLDNKFVKIGNMQWQCIVGYGHAPEHIALYNKATNILIAGDMVLPRISTNISVFDYEPLANPLPLFLESLERYMPLPTDVLILPSHGTPFKGLHERIQQLKNHHAERLAELFDFCSKPVCVTEVVPMMFKRELDLHQLTFAMGEALAHLHALYFDNKLIRTVDTDGVYRFVQNQ